MNKNPQLVSNCLVDTFGVEVKHLRRERNLAAAKSMTRFTVLLTLLFIATWFNFWIQ